MGWNTNFTGWVQQSTGVKFRGAFPTVQATAAFAHATAGTAPFFVSFSFVEDGIKENYFNREYRWDYDDPTSGNHTQSGESRNTDSTPVAGHVYETAGTYNPTVTLLDENGSILETQTVEIVIADPDVVFSGTNTICISQGGDFVGKPAGALEITASTTDLRVEVQPYFASNTRVLLRAGETWLDTTILGAVCISSAGFNELTIGSYGAGNRPIWSGSDRGTGTHYFIELGAGYNNADQTDIKLLDIDIQQTYFSPTNDNNNGWRGVSIAGVVNNVLLRNVRISDGYMGFYNSEDLHRTFKAPGTAFTKGWCLSGCEIPKQVTGAGGIEYGAFVHGTDSAIIDCEILHYGTHAIRTNYGRRMFYAHCEKRADGGSNPRDIYKIQSSHTNDVWFVGDPDMALSRHLVIASNNWQMGDNQQHPITGGKTDDSAGSFDQDTSYLLYQGNYIRVVGTGEQNGLASLSANKTVMRNCIIDLTNWNNNNWDMVSFTGRQDIAGVSGKFHAYNNTITEFGTFVVVSSLNLLSVRKDIADIYLNHNAWYCSTESAKVTNSGNGVFTNGDTIEPTVIVDNNFSYLSDPFVNSVGMSSFGDYVLTDSSTYGADVASRLGKIRLIDFGV